MWLGPTAKPLFPGSNPGAAFNSSDNPRSERWRRSARNSRSRFSRRSSIRRFEDVNDRGADALQGCGDGNAPAHRTHRTFHVRRSPVQGPVDPQAQPPFPVQAREQRVPPVDGTEQILTIGLYEHALPAIGQTAAQVPKLVGEAGIQLSPDPDGSAPPGVVEQVLEHLPGETLPAGNLEHLADAAWLEIVDIPTDRLATGIPDEHLEQLAQTPGLAGLVE